MVEKIHANVYTIAGCLWHCGTLYHIYFHISTDFVYFLYILSSLLFVEIGQIDSFILTSHFKTCWKTWLCEPTSVQSSTVERSQHSMFPALTSTLFPTNLIERPSNEVLGP